MQTDAFSTQTTDTDHSDPVTLLVGENKKFKTVADLAKGKMEADNFIQRLLQEKAELLDTLNKKQTEEQVQKSLQTTQETPPTNTNVRTGEDMKALVAQTVQSLFAEQEVQRNVVEVNKTLQEMFGEKAAEKVAQRASELNVGVDFLKSVAAKSPSAFYKLLDTGSNTPSGSVAQSTVTTQAAADTKVGKTWDDYKAMRKSNPALYHSPQVQQEIYKAVAEGRLTLPR